VNAWTKVLLLALLGLAILRLPLPIPAAVPQQRLIRIQSSRYAFSPGEIHANTGDTLTIELVSNDVAHSLSLDGTDFSLSADPGQVAVGTFVAAKPGVYRFRCTIPCGNLHPFMLGILRVGPDLFFLRGLALLLLALIVGLWRSPTKSAPPTRTAKSSITVLAV
jgi:plastocyanin